MEIGQRLIPHVIDALAQSHGDQTWAAFPSSFDALEKGVLQNVTWKIFSNSINRLAWWLKEKVGEGKDLETLCYLGPSDVRYFMFAVAACKTGHKALFTSPRNTLAAHLSLLEKTKCKTLIAVKSPTVQDIQDQYPITFLDIPTLDELLEEEEVLKFGFERSYHEVADLPFLVLHTSGSTGLPKPVEITHSLMASIDIQKTLPSIDGRPVTTYYYRDTDVYAALPPFHSAGINFFGFSVFQGTRLILGPPDKIPSLEVIEQMLDHNLARAGVMAPSLLEELAASPDLTKKLSSWNSVSFGGGPLPIKAGLALSAHTSVFNILGSTETKNIPELAPESAQEDWQYHEFHPSLGIDFRPYSENLYELVFVRQPEDGSYHAPFRTFRDLQEYSMKDLYSPHPAKKGLWLYQGRADDIIVMANGEKFNPIEAEQIITSHPDVKSALIVGATKEQTAVLIEPVNAKVSDNIWETVEKANECLPGHAKLDQDHIKQTETSQTFLRSTKGTVQRGPTIKALEDEIEQIYEAADAVSNSHDLDFSNTESLQRSIVLAFSKVGLQGTQNLGVDDDLFAFGLDSLQSFRVARLLQSSMKDFQITRRVVYSNPTVSKLAEALSKMKKGDFNENNEERQDAKQMQRMLDSCLSSLRHEAQQHGNETTHIGSKDTNIILTGSTGGLGCYLLHTLLEDVKVRVTCLNRAGSEFEKQRINSSEKGLDVDFSRVDFLEVDLVKDNFGLSEEQYNTLKAQTTHVIHNAWAVNFNLPINAFEDHVRGCERLISFSMQSENRPHIHFISSVGAANRWSDKHQGYVPEKAITDFAVSDNMGYAQSKQISELLFDHANQDLGVSCTVCRVGQITGPVKQDQGKWNKSEWFPSLIRSSIHLGKLPDSLGAMSSLDWIPVDLLAEIVVETVPRLIKKDNTTLPDTSVKDVSVPATPTYSPTSSSGPSELGSSRTSSTDLSFQGSVENQIGAQFIHLVNPHTSNWQDLISVIEGKTQVVSLEEWVKALQNSAEQDDVEKNPALKLLDFYEEIKVSMKPRFSTEQSESRSRTLAALEPVSSKWMAHWMKQWGFA